MRKIRLLLLGAAMSLIVFGFAPSANACPAYNGGSCSPGACHLVIGDPESGSFEAPHLECYY